MLNTFFISLFLCFLSLSVGAVDSFEKYESEIAMFLSEEFKSNSDSFSNHPRARAEKFEWGTRYTWEFPNEVVPHEKIGYIHSPKSSVRHIIRSTDDVIFDAVYTTDKFGRRVTKVPGQKKRERFAAFFGCSYAVSDVGEYFN
jgi:hypothetical protein